ncbi:hypothetical protein PF002_g1668 [Phytophthora fragariae]|uniref:Uncharacterized protein n=3 Tax=Phytophthora fragariae TaxID=53985 RepID=A0A6A3UEA1_9STRA|nr:hypothetical protein PF009_g1484 [Phytophthora fragariae]KAE9149168.1 hypothetical protein PF006_g6313 [Phytophthora fragariae]KAE9254037.1 hypothetical protein PF004_g1210 [Phytophthora fragariae]KAE9256762.1 hypothetical protein PF002_g1668 [Phytophthora fragariae]
MRLSSDNDVYPRRPGSRERCDLPLADSLLTSLANSPVAAHVASKGSMVTQAMVLNEVVVADPAMNDRKRVRGLQIEECREEELYERSRAKQKIVLGILFTVVALEALYLFGVVVTYTADWFILLLAVTRRLKRLHSQL